jgi:hypothetical protein
MRPLRLPHASPRMRVVHAMCTVRQASSDTSLAAWQIDGKARLVSARTPMRLAPVPSTSRMTFDERSVLSARPQREPSSPGLSPSRINLVDSTAVHQGSIASSLLGITSRVNPMPQYAQSTAPPLPPHKGQRTPTGTSVCFAAPRWLPVDALFQSLRRVA